MIKVLWLAPSFNHYKARFLNHLAKDASIDLTILSGTGRDNMGDQELQGDWSFNQIKLNVTKKDFGNSKSVKKELKEIYGSFDWVLIPAEKKNLLLFLFAMKLRKANNDVRLFSYNHPVLKSKNGKVTFIDKVLTKYYFKRLNRVIFYTEKSYDWAIKNNFIKATNAYWANNTIDNLEVNKHYAYQLPPKEFVSLVFIGRLIKSKRIEHLITYYKRLKEEIPKLQLEIIGDGPESHIVKAAINNGCNDIIWHGTLIDESKIAPIMSRATIVFIPGHSGLSINHAFSYGRPYVTLQGPSHAPELDYIDVGKNGYVLNGDFESNVQCIRNLLVDRTQLNQFCDSSKLKSDYLSVQNWVQQIKTSLLDE